jgi:site-specific recombinase XerD
MAVNEYLDSMQSVLKATTWKEYDRRYRRMHRDLLALHEEGKVRNINTKKIDEKDVLMYLQSLRARGMKDSGVAHNVDALAALLRYVGNGALEKARLKSPQHFPKYTRSRLDPIATNDRKAIIKATEKNR